jgi:hypothetical protein
LHTSRRQQGARDGANEAHASGTLITFGTVRTPHNQQRTHIPCLGRKTAQKSNPPPAAAYCCCNRERTSRKPSMSCGPLHHTAQPSSRRPHRFLMGQPLRSMMVSVHNITAGGSARGRASAHRKSKCVKAVRVHKASLICQIEQRCRVKTCHSQRSQQPAHSLPHQKSNRAGASVSVGFKRTLTAGWSRLP